MNKQTPMTASDKAAAAWGTAPDWIAALAAECDRTSQNTVARRLGYSAAALSQVINGRYNADSTALEQVVRGALMALTVTCPVVGDLAADACLAHQRAAWSPHNPQRIAFFRACRAGCPHSRIGGHDAV